MISRSMTEEAIRLAALVKAEAAEAEANAEPAGKGGGADSAREADGTEITIKMPTPQQRRDAFANDILRGGRDVYPVGSEYIDLDEDE